MLNFLLQKWVSLTLFGFFFVAASYQTWKAAAFIKHSQDTSLLSGFRKIFSVYSAVRSLAAPVPMVRGRRIRAARYAVELDILLSEGAPDFSPQRKKDILRSSLSTEPEGKWAWLVEQLGFGPSVPKPSDPIEVNDFPALDDNREAIARYFQVLTDYGIEQEPRFLTPVTIKTGYIAPLFLVSGLLNRFSEKEGWALIMDYYRTLVEVDKAKCSDELLELKSFLFNCWLLWGPSITHCSCETWQPANADAIPETKKPILLQYGYGDENNAIDVLMKPRPNQDLVEDISMFLNVPDKEKLAIPYSVTGVFRWGPRLKEGILPPAQALIKGTEAAPSEGRVILDCDSHYRLVDSTKYYTAYIWIMFAILNGDNTPLFDGGGADPEKRHRWKNILVYFEHANIAEPSTLLTLKKNLVAKTCASLREILGREADGHVKLRYICAVDDPFCAGGDRVFGATEQGSNLVDMLVQYARSEPGMKSIRQYMEGTDPRLILPLPEDGPELAKGKQRAATGYSSCEIPGIVEEFFRDLSAMKAARLPPSPPQAS